MEKLILQAAALVVLTAPTGHPPRPDKRSALGNYVSGQIPPSKRATVQKPGRPPYGYGYIDGQLVIDPREHSIVKQIVNLRKSGKSFNAIAIHLNGKKTPSRNQTQWTRSVIRGIILRHESKNAKPERE